MIMRAHLVMLVGLLCITSCTISGRPEIEFKPMTSSDFQVTCDRLSDCAGIISIWYIGSHENVHYFVQSQVGMDSEEIVCGYIIKGNAPPIKEIVGLSKSKVILYSTNDRLKTPYKSAPPFGTTELHNKITKP